MRFSILIPVYNTGKYLDQCMDSVLGQSFSDYEIILVNDGSTDDSGKRCDSYQDPRIRVVHQENQGLLMARRTGVALAKGEYCIFLDSDDTITDDALAQIDAKLRQTGAQILMFNTALVYQDDFSKPKPRKPVFAQDRVFSGEAEKRPIYETLLEGWLLNNLVLKAIRTDLVQSDDTDYQSLRDNSIGEDLLQTLYPVTHAETIAYTGECYYYYRQSETSMTRAPDVSDLKKRFARYNPHLLEARVRYAQIWGMQDEENTYRIYSAALRELRSVFQGVFGHCKDAEVRKQWCALPWEEVLPKEAVKAVWDKRIKLSAAERLQLHCVFRHRVGLLKAMAAVQEIKRKN